jgi:hypothetical protein
MSYNSMKSSTTEIVVSGVSIFLYATLAVVSFVLCGRICRRFRHGTDDFVNATPFARYDGVRMMFFGVLGTSATLDLPLYIACIANHGDDACIWDGAGYSMVWLLHLFALIGYFLCLGIPLILWSNILRGSDTRLFGSSLADTDISNICLLFSYLVYIAIICVEVGYVGYHFDDTDAFHHNRVTDTVRSIESVFYAFVAGMWVLFGLRLRTLLPIVQDRKSGLGKMLMVANVFMFVIFASYIIRAVLIMAQSLKMGRVGRDDFIHEHFAFWTVGTRWLPYIICSILLIVIMNFTARSKASDSKHKSLRAPFSNSNHSSDGDNVDDNLIGSPSKLGYVPAVFYDGIVDYRESY